MTTSSRDLPPAPWRADFLADLSTMSMPLFVLSTVGPAEETAAGGGPAAVPRARTVKMRGMFGQLGSGGAVSSELLTITTDRRMAKVAHVLAGGDAALRTASGSGGGAPVEAVVWAERPQVQWRLAGRAYVVARDADADADALRAVLQARMRGPTEEWSFSRELTAHFAQHSPLARGRFRNPPPGRPMDKEQEARSLGQLVHDLDDQVARENFCLLVVAPEEVDRRLDAENRRRRYRLLHNGEWEETELWP